MKKFFAGCALAALATGNAYAQSTGSQTIEQSPEIVVTGTVTRSVQGVVIPDVPKTRSVLTQELIARQPEGQSILNTINLVPGVNYTNSDPYGSSGGNLRIRGFPGNRIALLWDGLPLNDTGNYAIFGNQIVDPELIDRVSVNLGTTDVDSPTPSAAGGVVSYRTIVPAEEFGAQLRGSIGDFDYGRGSALIQTGNIFGTGVRAFVEASDTQYSKFRGPGKIHKSQYNFRIYKDLGSAGDFISIAGHYNRNRNAFYNNGLASDFAANRKFDYNPTCGRDPATAGVADNDGAATTTNTTIPGVAPSLCTNFVGVRINPSNTGNIRASARYTITPGLIFTVDPGYQYTLANGGGTTTLLETSPLLTAGVAGVTGVDLNGDGDTRDTVRVYTPNNTRTNRYTLLSSLIWEVNPQNRLRVAYSFDKGYHRQTGQYGFVDLNGNPLDPFGGKHEGPQRIVAANGGPVQGRSRYSIAMLNQISGEYFGRFFEDRLTVTAGIRAPFFERRLNQTCYTQITTNTQVCTPTSAGLAAGAVVVPVNFTPTGTIPANYYFAPFKRTVKYNPILPSAGVTFKLTPVASVYASYGKNFSTPSTDNLYRSPNINPKPEKTDVFEAGFRYTASKVQGQVATYYNKYKNRIVTALDADPASPTFGTTTDRNVGDARSYGVDAQLSYKPINQIQFYGFASWINAKLKDNFSASTTSVIPTAGARFVETPEWQYGGRASVFLGPVTAGVQVKHVSKRYSTDDNGRSTNAAGQVLYLLAAGGTGVTGTAISGVPINQDGSVKGYTTVDLDARIKGSWIGMGDKTSISINVINVTNKYYFGNLSTQNTLAGGPRFSVGAPRTFQGTITIGF